MSHRSWTDRRTALAGMDVSGSRGALPYWRPSSPSMLSTIWPAAICRMLSTCCGAIAVRRPSPLWIHSGAFYSAPAPAHAHRLSTRRYWLSKGRPPAAVRAARPSHKALPRTDGRTSVLPPSLRPSLHHFSLVLFCGANVVVWLVIIIVGLYSISVASGCSGKYSGIRKSRRRLTSTIRGDIAVAVSCLQVCRRWPISLGSLFSLLFDVNDVKCDCGCAIGSAYRPMRLSLVSVVKWYFDHLPGQAVRFICLMFDYVKKCVPCLQSVAVYTDIVIAVLRRHNFA